MNIVVVPVLFEDQVMAVIELASFTPFSEAHLTFLEQLSETLGVVLNTIVATMRTEELLQQSQGLTLELQSQSEELQAQRDELERTNRELEEQARSLKASEELLQQQQEELQQTNEELEEKAGLLAEQNARIEQKNTEVENARVELEEKAEQLALSSKYKSEFLANMSHELRTPLNSLLILAKLLADNQRGDAHRQAGRVREDDPQCGLRPARADQRHPRPVEGRGREDGRQRGGRRPGDDRRLHRQDVPPGRGSEASAVRRDPRRRPARVRSSPTSSGCSRS